MARLGLLPPAFFGALASLGPIVFVDPCRASAFARAAMDGAMSGAIGGALSLKLAT